MAELAYRSAAPPSFLSTVVYHSRAVAPLSDSELQRLMETAQARNRREAITGVMLYEERRFFQWLEGPAASVERVMSSIRNDHRHTDVEVVAHQPARARRFDGWDMKLATREADPAKWKDEILEPAPEIIDGLNRRPNAAPSLLVKLVPLRAGTDEGALATSLQGVAMVSATAAVLKTVFLETVVPQLLSGHALSGIHLAAGALADPASCAGRVPAHPRAAELAELLVASDHAASLELIRELRGDRCDPRHLFAPLLEPAARSLGDLWGEDLCSEFDVTLGLIRLQSAARLLGSDTPPAAPHGPSPNVLIVPVPGELHQLSACLDSEWLLGEGWSPRSEHPADDGALADLLSSNWVDVLDLSLSAAFRREDALPRLSRTIVQARRASRNPALYVVVGGRIFVDDNSIRHEVGADMSSFTSLNVDRLMMQGLGKPAA